MLFFILVLSYVPSSPGVALAHGVDSAPGGGLALAGHAPRPLPDAEEPGRRRGTGQGGRCARRHNRPGGRPTAGNC